MAISRKYIQWGVTLTATLSLFSCGVQYSWPSPALEKIKREHLFNITNEETSWAVSSLNVGGFSGSILSGFLLESIGRKWSIIGLNGPFIIGGVLIYFGTSPPWLYAARFTLGLAVGVSLSVVPIYVGEIASTEIRGSLGTLTMIMSNVGVLVVYVCGPFISYSTLALASCAVPIFCMVFMLFMPESPVFLLDKGRDEEAKKSVAILHGTSKNHKDVGRELNNIKKSVNDRKKTPLSWKAAIRSEGCLKAFVIVCFLGLTQQMCGSAALLSYFEQINQLGKSSIDPYIAYIIIGVIQVVSGLLSSWTVEKCGRKPLFLTSCILQMLPFVALGAFFFLRENESMMLDSVSWLPLILIAIILASFNFGQGPLVYVFVGEILPLEIRAYGATCASLCLSLGAFGSNAMFPLISPYISFWLSAGFVLLSSVFVFVIVPETKGKVIDEIRLLLAKGCSVL